MISRTQPRHITGLFVLMQTFAVALPAGAQKAPALKSWASPKVKSTQKNKVADQKKDYGIVPLIRVIANPGDFEGKKISVTGFVCDHFECCAMYPTQEYADLGLSESAIWLDLDPKTLQVVDIDGRHHNYSSLDRKYVTLSGVFTSRAHGFMGLFYGSLKNVIGATERRGKFSVAGH